MDNYRAPDFMRLALVACVGPLLGLAQQPSGSSFPSGPEMFDDFPLTFEPNRGQAGLAAKFVSHAQGYNLCFTSTGMVISLGSGPSSSVSVKMNFSGANPAPVIENEQLLGARSNYLIGNDPAKWHMNVPNYARIRYREVYPGVDLIFYGNQRRIEYDVLVAPGADPNVIRLSFEGAQQVSVDQGGDLVLQTPGGEIRQRTPAIYQESNDGRKTIRGRYRLEPDGTVKFVLAQYDRKRPLVIDPVLVYSTYLGKDLSGATDARLRMAVDASGNTYVTGETAAFDFPVLNAFQGKTAGNFDIFVSKLNASGSGLVYSTYLGGSELDGAAGIAVDAVGHAYITGRTRSADFPTTRDAFQPRSTGRFENAFVTKLNTTGTALVYSTYLGGDQADRGKAIAVDASGHAYVAGSSQSSDFPIKEALRPRRSLAEEAFVTKLNPSGSALIYSTFLGAGDSRGIAVNGAGEAYVLASYGPEFPATARIPAGPGCSIVVAKLNAAGSAFAYGTCLDFGNPFAIAVDKTGAAYFTGETNGFPVTDNAFQKTYAGGYDAFVAKLNPEGSRLVYGSYLGGSGEDSARGIAVNAAGEVYLAGYTRSSNFPAVNPIQTYSPTGSFPFSAFVAKVNATGSALQFSTYLFGSSDNVGGIGGDVAVDPSGNAHIFGSTSSSQFPTTPGAFGFESPGQGLSGFVAKIRFEPSLVISQSGFRFQTVAGGGTPPSQLFHVLNGGSDPLNWTATVATLSGGPSWLSITPSSGRSDAAASPPAVEVRVNPAGLNPGDYYATIQIAAPGVSNSPQVLSVVLNVLPSDANPGPVLQPSGLLFTAAPGTSNPTPQAILVTNLTNRPLSFTSSVTFGEGRNWFAYQPATGTVAPGQPAPIEVRPNITGLAAGVYTAELAFRFSDNTERRATLLLVVAAGSRASSLSKSENPPRPDGACSPTKLLPVFTSLGPNFTATVGWPTPLEIRVLDDCGDPQLAGSVVINFSNADPPVFCSHVGAGRWSGTWLTRGMRTPQTTITARAQLTNPKIEGSTQITGGLQTSSSPPIIAPGGAVSAASYIAQAPLAPGSLLTIFGSRLAQGAGTASALPLPSELAGTLAAIAGRPLPLIFTDDGQVNAVVPHNLPVNVTHQLILRRGVALSTPEPVMVAPAQPAIFTKDQSGKGQGIILVASPDGTQYFAEPGAPASPGSIIVIYCSGLGAVDPPVTAGTATPSAPLSSTINAVSVSIGEQPAEVLFAGLTPGFTGLYQINAVVPAGAGSGNAVPLVVTVAGQTSQTVTIAIR